MTGLNADDEPTFKKKGGQNVIPDLDEDNYIPSPHLVEIPLVTNLPKHKKPDNIPILMLDLIDDDKSQSVTVSLAKSMCKEIDYKKEMEKIYTLPLVQPSQVNSPELLSPKQPQNPKKLKKINKKPSSTYTSPVHTARLNISSRTTNNINNITNHISHNTNNITTDNGHLNKITVQKQVFLPKIKNNINYI